MGFRVAVRSEAKAAQQAAPRRGRLWLAVGVLTALAAIADVRRREFTFPTVRAERQRVALLEAGGYQAVIRRDGYVVLRGPRAAR